MCGYGSEIKASARGELNTDSISLLNGFQLGDGILFAYRSYVTAPTQVIFQVWRPMGEPEDRPGMTFNLVGETTFNPTRVDPGQEDVSLNFSKVF